MNTNTVADLGSEGRGMTPAELALVGEISLLLDGGRDLDGLDAALACLRAYMKADVCEMFLATASGQEREMVLVAHQGADPEAFCQRDRFRPGEGFPGIVLSTGVPLVTRLLHSEADFQRSRVQALGYTSAVCVPARCGAEVCGCLFLAWRKAPSRVVASVRTALLAALPIGAATEATRARARTFAAAGAGGPGPELEALLKRVTAADDVRVVTDDLAGAPGACEVLRTGRPQAHGARVGWPETCIRSHCVCRARYCVPLKSGGDVWAVATVAFERQAPVPLTRRLPAALWLAEAVTPPAPGGSRPLRLRAPAEPDRDPEAHLRIRCLGGFDVWVDDHHLRPPDFGRSKARELLALLVLAAGKPVPADDLARELWPGVSGAPLRNRFHVTLNALRRAVEPPYERARGWLHLRSEAGRYYLDPHSGVHVDLWHFDSLLRHAALPEALGRRRADASEALGRAVHLYGGDPFEGAFDGDWVRGVGRHRRDRLARIMRSVHGDAQGPTTPH